jgi:cobalt-zinc-cadmium efflux system protein
MHIWEITSGMYSLTAHMEADLTNYENTNQLIDKINKILDEEYGIEHTTIQIEPVSTNQ